MKVGILTQYFPPELGAPQQRLSALAERLAARGHEVVVLTAMPSYPRGKTFDGYGGMHLRHTIRGVDVHRVPAYPTQSPRMGRRLLNYGSFMATSALMGPRCFGRGIDVLLTESPPLFLGVTGYWLSRVCNARWIFNVSDLWPDSAVSLGVVRESAALRAAYALESFCYRKAWLVTGQSREIVANVSRRFPSVSTYHLSNGVDTALFQPGAGRDDLRARLRQGRGCSVLYAGLHGLAQGLDHLVAAAERLREDDVFITLVGDGPVKQALKDRAATSGPLPIQFIDPQPADAMPAWIASADVSLVPLAMHIPGAVPSKLYEAMASARPVVLMASGEAADVVRRHECGVVVESGDVGNLTASLRALARDAGLRDRLGRAGREAAKQQFDRDDIVGRFATMLEREACAG
jgi:glycosyltransferase involved in cell wall biosynthesis